ncbi:copper amine oxidase N-terminal domain-containing protein [Bacillus solimangrovi]|uniref:Copper amine oxidase-like N-terminal domain-containing protein n=1 Tax=Bacillus solimangrovi TaxID=1305675 RepID=A0A1E5LIC7_9BACI|nr:copper amine oxidase N-terminal domain-containing protein [Bacillus solimangrovi]OEH93827.1 hypothetical protein BFG57_10925 [Bacillus solimangrovi]
MINKWSILLFVVTIYFVLSISQPNVHAESTSTTKLIVAGETVTEQLTTITYNGRTLIPLRTVSEALNVQVKWNSKTSTVIVQKWGEQLSIKPNAHQAKLQGRVYHDVILDLQSPAQLKDGSVYVPLRFIAQTFGYEVNWDNGEIRINSPLSEEERERLYRGSL